MMLPVALSGAVVAIRPSHSWDTVGAMTFFHSCNESGLFSDRALDTITKFPAVTIEKGQAFHQDCSAYGKVAPCAEDKIIAQCAAVKKRNDSISTVFYMNSVLDWYFYHIDVDMKAHPEWQLKDSKTGEAVHAGGDKTFNPPKGGMLVFNHGVPAMREYWKNVCINATRTGHVDGCFSDSSQYCTHGSCKHLNDTDKNVSESGKIQTMAEMTAFFGGEAGKPYKGSTGVLIGKKPDQAGINAFQIEFFSASEGSIQELMAGVKQGYMVQAHSQSKEGCRDMQRMTDEVSAFLIGAGDDSYFGSGPWISQGIEDIESRWCASLFERPLGAPKGPAVKTGDTYRRSFASGTVVEFDVKAGKGTIQWAG